MRRLAIALAAAAALAAGTLQASAERLITSISRHQVLVSSNFTGTSIVLFGTIEPDTPTARRRAATYNLVAVVSGPKQTTVTRRKERVLGIWTNADSRTFVGVPSYLAVLANRAIPDIASADLLRRLQIGFDNTVLPQQIGADVGDVARDDPFRANFIRLKRQQGLYMEVTNGVTFLTPTVFRAGIPLPAGTPVGNYDVTVRVFADGNQLAQANSAFEVVKVGFEQFIAGAAHDYGLLYGIATAIMAIFTGWLASVMFRKD
ncbi:MAG: TIGR02186 family protein [Alphaproteobacteria bacterium]|nr:TIGR02186 family protein [Alphaproteobacteria bacterium]